MLLNFWGTSEKAKVELFFVAGTRTQLLVAKTASTI